MAPNAEEDLLVTMPRGSSSSSAAAAAHTAKERLRPPTYNPEDYAMALRRWGRRAFGVTSSSSGGGGGNQSDSNNQGTLPSTCTSSSSGYASAGNNAGEMTLRQFTSVSELLNKLRADLRLAFPSFVQEFASPPADGISLLLETLRGIQLSQTAPPSSQAGPRRPRARRAALDELGCVECLAVCLERCPDAARILAAAHPGLLALAVCLTSSLNRSRVLALQLLTRVCQTSGGHGAVSEAVSTLRLRYGEGGRFRFLAGALLAPKSAMALRLAGVSFLNAFLSTAPKAQTKLYIQAEACEAGLEPRALQEWLKYTDDEDPMSELLREEVRKWSRHCVDVDALLSRARRAEETCLVLSKKVTALQKQLQKLQLERINDYNCGRSKQQLEATAKSASNGDVQRDEDRHTLQNSRMEADKKVSSSAEDEGISFSERSSSPEDHQQHQPNRPETTSPCNVMDNDQETTIDDVIEELRIIVKDAEEELHDWNQLQESSPKTRKNEFGKPVPTSPPVKVQNSAPSKAREYLRSCEENARIDRSLKPDAGLTKIVVSGPQQQQQSQGRDVNSNEEDDKESAIVPAFIHPQPPRRAPACVVTNSVFLQQHVRNPIDQDIIDRHRAIEIESDHDEDLLMLDDDGSDSLLSASRLNYHIETAKLPITFNNRNYNEESTGIYRRRRSSSSELKIESLADFEISETILDERAPRKRLENNHNSNSLGSKQYSKCSNTVQRRTERRKYLRRCQSQEHIENQESCSLKSRNSGRGVIDHIRKFESLNSFDDRRSLPNFDDQNARLRRSESFHQTRLSKEYCSSSRGGSDSGLMYSVVDSEHKSMTKSLDRIDESMNSMIHTVVSKDKKQQLCRRSSSDDRPLRNDARHHRQSRDRQRVDYEDVRRKYRSHRDESSKVILDDRKYTSFLETRRDRSTSGNRQHQNDSSIFAGRPHDVLGFGKNRFNAGKYSGSGHHQQSSQSPHHHHQQQQQQQYMTKNVHRHVSASPHHVRGKVTDMVSGLY